MKYSYQGNIATSAKASARSVGISGKQSIEICNAIRKKPIDKAKAILVRAMTQEQAIPFKRFQNIGHKPGPMGTGKYPMKACTEILKLVEAAEANAQLKGLNTSDLIIKHIATHKGAKQWHYGRFFRRKMKRVNLEIVLEEKKSKPKEKTPKPAPKTDAKKDAKPVKPSPKAVESKPVAKKPVNPTTNKEQPKGDKK
tara:strand:+ start:6055 stop:6645 length:591 start_codon:yes stop_codon:yes gene_type:complete